jgi:hypothetical protein
MFWSVMAHPVTLLIDLGTARRPPEDAKDLEILLLRHQLRVLQRRLPQPRLARWERLTLALLATKLRRLPAGARRLWTRSLVLVTPETVLRWHRDLVRRKWTYRQRRHAGRHPCPGYHGHPRPRISAKRTTAKLTAYGATSGERA